MQVIRERRGAISRVATMSLLTIAIGACGTLDGYEGEGEVTRLTTLATFPRLAARIDFPAFSLRTPFSRVYSIKGLPRLHYNYIVGLAITNVEEQSGGPWPPPELRDLTGNIEFHFLDADGHEVKRASGTMMEMYWERKEGDVPFGSLSTAQDPEMAVLRASDHEVARWHQLKILFEPGLNVSDLQAQVRIVSDTD